jgi:hypothetical protein
MRLVLCLQPKRARTLDVWPRSATFVLRGKCYFTRNWCLIRAPVQVRLDVATDGHVQAAYAEAPGHRLPLPLQLSPALKAEYFDVR